MDLQTLGNITDADRARSRTGLHRQQKLVLLWLNPGSPGGLFAEPQKPPDLVPEFAQCLLVHLIRISVGSHACLPHTISQYDMFFIPKITRPPTFLAPSCRSS